MRKRKYAPRTRRSLKLRNIFARAIRIIENQAHWTQGVQHDTFNGIDRFCAVGALREAIEWPRNGEFHGSSDMSPNDPRHRAFTEARHLLSQAAEHAGYDDVIALNDTGIGKRTAEQHRKVLAAFKRAHNQARR